LIHQEPAFAELFIAHLLGRTIRVEADLVDQLFKAARRAKNFGGHWGCMASIREVLNAASADSERCGKLGDWVRCMEKLIDADHGAK
jgi:hypothetical protein